MNGRRLLAAWKSVACKSGVNMIYGWDHNWQVRRSTQKNIVASLSICGKNDKLDWVPFNGHSTSQTRTINVLPNSSAIAHSSSSSSNWHNLFFHSDVITLITLRYLTEKDNISYVEFHLVAMSGGIILIGNPRFLRVAFQAGSKIVVEWKTLNTNLHSYGQAHHMWLGMWHNMCTLTSVFFTGWMDSLRSMHSSGVSAATSSTHPSLLSSSPTSPSSPSYSCSVVSSSISISAAISNNDLSSSFRALLSSHFTLNCFSSALATRFKMWVKHQVQLRDEYLVSESSNSCIIVLLFDTLLQVTESIFVSILKLHSTAVKAHARFTPLCDWWYSAN